MQSTPDERSYKKSAVGLGQDNASDDESECSPTSSNAAPPGDCDRILPKHLKSLIKTTGNSGGERNLLSTTIRLAKWPWNEGDEIELEPDYDNQRTGQTLLLDTGSPVSCITEAKVKEHKLEKYVNRDREATSIPDEKPLDRPHKSRLRRVCDRIRAVFSLRRSQDNLKHQPPLPTGPYWKDYNGHEIQQVGTMKLKFRVTGDEGWETIIIRVVRTDCEHDIDWLMGREHAIIWSLLMRQLSQDPSLTTEGLSDYEREIRRKTKPFLTM